MSREFLGKLVRDLGATCAIFVVGYQLAQSAAPELQFVALALAGLWLLGGTKS